MNLAETLDRTARGRGRFAALRLDDEVTSFDEVDCASRRVAGFLRGQGLRAGDRVGLMLPDVPEFAALYYGILRLGAVVVPMSVTLTRAGVLHRLRDSGAGGVVAWESARAAVVPPADALGIPSWLLEAGGLPHLVGDTVPVDAVQPRALDDVAVIIYTAGTTGEPIGAAITHGNLLRNCEVFVNDLVQLTSHDVVFGGLPLSHAFGQTVGLNASIRAGACLVLVAQRDGEAALGTLRHRGVTVMEGGPALYDAILSFARRAEGDDLPPLRVCVSGGAAMPVEVLLGFEEAFGCVILEGYGLAETSPLASSNRMDSRRVGSIGLPVSGVELRVVDSGHTEVPDGEQGEIVVRGHNLMKGYWGRPAETTAAIVDGWLHTGDVGIKDEDGFFHVVGRAASRASRSEALT